MAEPKRLSVWIAAPVALAIWGVSSLWNWASSTWSEPADKFQLISADLPEIQESPAVVERDIEDQLFICRAAIAELMGRELSTISGVRRADGSIGTSYRRPTDGSIWQNVCKLDGTHVLWASIESNGQVGRWRTSPADEIVTYVLIGKQANITQTFSDGSSVTDTFVRD